MSMPAPIVAKIAAGMWCRHCYTAHDGPHEHRWQPPMRCNEHLVLEDVSYQCERDAGHDRGPFPRQAWDNGRDAVGRWIVEATPHLVTWTTS